LNETAIRREVNLETLEVTGDRRLGHTSALERVVSRQRVLSRVEGIVPFEGEATVVYLAPRGISRMPVTQSEVGFGDGPQPA
jgi:hypothetical protein